MTNETEHSNHSCFFDLLACGDFKEGVHWRRCRYPSGEVILREGGYSGKVFLILTGAVRVTGSVALGSSHTVRPGVKDLKPGEIFGELALLDQSPHSATVATIEDSELAEIDNEALLAYLEHNQSVGFRIFRGLALELVGRLRKADEKIFSLLAWGLKVHGYEKYT
jgi:CRP-like cAMP-binding protein